MTAVSQPSISTVTQSKHPSRPLLFSRHPTFTNMRSFLNLPSLTPFFPPRDTISFSFPPPLHSSPTAINIRCPVTTHQTLARDTPLHAFLSASFLKFGLFLCFAHYVPYPRKCSTPMQHLQKRSHPYITSNLPPATLAWNLR